MFDMNSKLNATTGTRLNFEANGNPVSGTIIGSERSDPLYASVKVETSDTIPNGAQLTIPDLPDAGGCGLAHPIPRGVRAVVVLSVGYSFIDLSTIGK